MKTLKKIVEWFIVCFCVLKSTDNDDVVVSEFESRADFLKTTRLIKLHGRRARSQSLPNPWALSR